MWRAKGFAEDMEQGQFYRSTLLLVKHPGWWLIFYDYVGAEQVPGALHAYEKDLLHEYDNRLFKCFESAQRTTDADFMFF